MDSVQVHGRLDDTLARLPMALGPRLQVVLSPLAGSGHFVGPFFYLLTACLIVDYHAANCWTPCIFIGGRRIIYVRSYEKGIETSNTHHERKGLLWIPRRKAASSR